MPITKLTLPDLHAAYDRWLGKPISVVKLRRDEVNDRVPTELDILFFQPSGMELLPEPKQFTYIATAGMSTRTLQGPYEQVEMILRVDGRHTLDELRLLGRSFAQLATVPFREEIALAPNQLFCGVRLPIFANMSCVLITHWAVVSEKWLLNADPDALVLSVIPIFENEAETIREIGDIEANRRFLHEGINWHHPLRPPAVLTSVPETVSSAPIVERSLMTSQEITEAIRQTWVEIESWYREKASETLGELEEGATDQQIKEFEDNVALPLPEDYKASLKLHNGGGRIHNYDYLSRDQSLDRWRMMKQLKDEGKFDDRTIQDDSGRIIKNTWWHPGWIPVAEHKAGSIICLDLAPGEKGIVGQILQMESLEEGPLPTEHKSFLEWLQAYKNDLLNHRYQVDEYGNLNPK